MKKLNTIRKLNPKSSDTSIMGLEPEWSVLPSESTRKPALIKALNWYNYFYGKKDAKDMIIQYLEVNDRSQDAKKFRSVPDSQVRVTTGWVCRMSLVGFVFTKDEENKINAELDELLAKHKETKITEDTGEPVLAKPNIQDHLREKLSECAGELEGMLDEFIIAGNKTSEFKPISLIRGMNVAPQLISNITQRWRAKIAELELALNQKDSQLVEAYSYLTKPQLKNLIKFCETVINDCDSYVQVKKIERKPRTRKAVSPEKIASRFKFLKEFTELKLKSESPVKLVEAAEAWLYNTANRKLIHVVADSHAGKFTIKGSSIIGFDAVATVQKTLRKPEAQLKLITSAGKPVARKEFTAIKSIETKWNGRSNENLIILKAW